jgi:acyl transferase domain-containing protein/alpha-ketoglutarate-dependent taurine dioxygenase
MSETNETAQWSGLEVAVVGMAGRFPGAANITEFWRNLSGGVESITFFTDEEAVASGADPSLVAAPNYVKAGALLEGIELFDASFFGYSHREAELIDPQQRLFLECAHEALEHAGYGANERGGRVGVYAGSGLNTYLLNLASSPALLEAFGPIQVLIANDKDFLATRASYKLNLEGPSVSVQTACSTSLVAVHMACRSLLGGDCDMALAGGVSVNGYMRAGYLYQEGGILSPDGHCRAFDARAKGTVFGSGVGIVVLKRLEDAIADGDTIHAVIKGSSINNDGASKIGYTAPRAEGQAQVVRAAQLMAEVAPETITYIEAHGTGTELGDPIELDALTQVFAGTTARKNFCAVGSLKTNIGHLDAAAGVSGLIKTVLALKHRVMPPSLHFERPNPKIDFTDSPFYINSRRSEWARGETPRRAGVSSFGIGGTNAHVVLEEAPPVEATASPARSRQLLVLSARSRAALEMTTANLASHLRQNPETDLADVAYTLQVGRTAHNMRRTLVCRDAAEAASALEDASSSVSGVFTSTGESQERPVIFMFPGQGTQYANMGRELYRDEQTFRAEIDRCAELLRPHLGLDLREALYPSDRDREAATQRLRQTSLTQPALFAVEYALAKLWMEWGVKPAMMIGHSVGEYVAACLAGVLSLEDALMLVAERGSLIQRLPEGAMLAVPLPEARITNLLGEGLSLAAVNAPSLCVVSGAADEIDALHARLKAEGVESSRLHTSHAFHSQMMEPALAPFVERLGKVKLSAPSIPYVSNVTGNWITAAEATDPGYWARHLRQAVRFADGLATLTKDRACVLLEVGPGATLSTLVRQQRDKAAGQLLLTSLPRAGEQRSDSEQMLSALGQLWASGARVNWTGFHAGAQRRRVPLPTYPFERQRYWIEAQKGTTATAVAPRVDASREEEVTAYAALHPRPELQNSFVAPQGEVETRVAAIWQELLGTEQVGADDNFFDLGGHSLLATGVVSRLREEFRVELSLRELFERPTVRGIAETLSAATPKPREDKEQRDAREDLIERRAERGTFQLSFAQQRLWFLDQLTPGDSQHNMPISVRLRGALDVPVMERALNEVVSRHESLRTTFAVIESEPVQIVAPSITLRLAVTDLREMPGEARTSEAMRLAAEEQRRAFDLSRGPLIRAQLLRLDEDEHMLLLTLHHIVSDAWSFAVFTQELSALYRAFAEGRPSPLAELPIQYADFAEWQRRRLTGALLDEQLAYWKQRLAGAPPLLALPADRPRPAVQSHEGASLAFELPARLADGLQELSRREGATLFMTLLAAFQTLLHRYTGEPDIIVGADIANRNRRELEGLIGFFVNMLVLRTDMAGDPSFLKLLERVREATLGAYAHQDVPFDKLVEELQPARNPSYSPLFQVVFNFYQDPAEGINLPGLDVSVLDSYQNVSKFDLSLFVGQRADGIRGFWSYSTALFDAKRIERLHAMFVTLLESILDKPETRLGALEVATEAERQEQLKAGRELKASGFKKFKSLKPRAVSVAPESLVRTERLLPDSALPLVVRPVSDEVDLASWAKVNSEFIETNLLKHGGLLFRGFKVESVDDFDCLARAVSPALLDYNEPSSPRSEVGQKIYTSTEYPASQWIQLHNEMSYTRHWPHKVLFCCVQPAERGGETPIASSREVYELLDPRLRERFIERRVMYVRNFSPGLDLSWQHVFGTTSKTEVEDYCRRAGIGFEWKGHDRLRTMQVQQSVLRHPTTAEVVWFNQAHAFHAASLEPAVREALRSEMSEDDFPRNAYYGDGSPIEDSVIEEIREAYRRAAVTFAWQQGDVLMLENMLVAHGRAPFSGARRILVAMSELIHETGVDTLRDCETQGEPALVQV